jgi:hypothetical protein
MNAAATIEILKLLMAGNLVKFTDMRNTAILHVHRNNFLNELDAPNLIVQYNIISHAYSIKLPDSIKTDLCPEQKNYLNKCATY